jgi:hypothetical protein
LSRLVVEQIQKAFDAVAVLDRKVSAAHDSAFSSEAATVEEKPQVVKDPWSFASSWIAFVQNSKDRFVAVLGAYQNLTQDASLDVILSPMTDAEERTRLALIWSETTSDELRSAIQLVILQNPVAEVKALIVDTPQRDPIQPTPEAQDATISDVSQDTAPEDTAPEVKIETVDSGAKKRKNRKFAVKKPDLII